MGAPELADLMHYETRIIRGHLDQSQQRLLKARHHVASKDLTPVLEDVQKLQDWRPAHGGVPVDVLDLHLVDSPPLHEMQRALKKFEQSAYQTAPSKDKAFFSALRCLLSEILTEHDAEERGIKLRAVCKWFLKHKPRGTRDDSSTSAVLATSLSIPTVPRQAKAAAAPGAAHVPFTTQGTKHEFQSAFTRGQDAQAQQPKSTLALLRAAMGGGQQQQPDQKHTPAPPLDMPLVWQPAMAPGHAPPPKPSHARKPSKPPPSHAHGDDGEEGPADVIGCVPRDRMRGVFEAPAGGQPGAASWFQGPFNPDSKAAPGAAARGRGRAAKDPRAAELRAKWAGVADTTLQSDVHVGRQVQTWSEGRARFEGEMLRRQEASRHGSPLRAAPQPAPPHGPPAAGAGAPQGAQGYSSGYIGAYSGVTVEAVGAVASGLDALSPHHPPALHQLVLPHSIAATAREVRAAAAAEYEHDAARITQRMQELGISALGHEPLAKALAPVADKAYLDCLSALPKPGEHLESRPGSVASRARKKPGSAKGRKRGK